MSPRKPAGKKNLFWDLPPAKPGENPSELVRMCFEEQLSSDSHVTDRETDDSWGQLAVKVAQADRSKVRRAPWLYRLAAACLGLLLVTTAGWYAFRHAAFRTLHTAYGEIRSVRLPDGSTVTLNANSTLRYRKALVRGNLREVYLQGEAFFRVRKAGQGNHPVKFVVHTGELDVEVLGTVFNVAARRARTQVVLQSGKVQLRLKEANKVIAMQPGDLVAVSAESPEVEQKPVRPEQYASWQRREWLLHNAPLRELADKIEDTYGLTVVFADPAQAGLRLHGSFPSDDLAKLMQILSASTGLQIRREQNTLFIQ